MQWQTSLASKHVFFSFYRAAEHAPPSPSPLLPRFFSTTPMAARPLYAMPPMPKLPILQRSRGRRSGAAPSIDPANAGWQPPATDKPHTIERRPRPATARLRRPEVAYSPLTPPLPPAHRRQLSARRSASFGERRFACVAGLSTFLRRRPVHLGSALPRPDFSPYARARTRRGQPCSRGPRRLPLVY
jgi:hypothetical protein